MKLQKVGKSRSSVANLLRILKLPRAVIELLQGNKLSFSHARVLISLKDEHDKIINFAQKVVDQNLSVRDLEKLLDFEKVRTKGSDGNGKVEDPYFNDRIKNLQDTLTDLTGKKIKIKTKGNTEKGSIEFKFANTAGLTRYMNT